MAPRSKLTKQTTEIVKTALLCGATIETAAAHAGIGRSTLNGWKKRGLAEDGDYTDDAYGEFALMVDQSIATWEMGQLATIEAASDDGIWTAGAWLLERRWPERYGKRTAVALNTEDGPIVVKLAFDPDA